MGVSWDYVHLYTYSSWNTNSKGPSYHKALTMGMSSVELWSLELALSSNAWHCQDDQKEKPEYQTRFHTAPRITPNHHPLGCCIDFCATDSLVHVDVVVEQAEPTLGPLVKLGSLLVDVAGPRVVTELKEVWGTRADGVFVLWTELTIANELVFHTVVVKGELSAGQHVVWYLVEDNRWGHLLSEKFLTHKRLWLQLQHRWKYYWYPPGIFHQNNSTILPRSQLGRIHIRKFGEMLLASSRKKRRCLCRRSRIVYSTGWQESWRNSRSMGSWKYSVSSFLAPSQDIEEPWYSIVVCREQDFLSIHNAKVVW